MWQRLAAAEGAHALVIATEWEQFRALDLGRLRSLRAQPVIVDLRNIYRADEVSPHGFAYASVGRPAAPHLSTAGPLLERLMHLVRVQAGAPSARSNRRLRKS